MDRHEDGSAGADAAGAPAGEAPLAGIRVLEFGYGVAAPVCCRNLAQFGADAIRVESVRKPDSLRIVGAGWVPAEVPWEILRDTGAAINFTCADKRSIGLELDHPTGKAIFDRLVAQADVLVMNMSVDAVAGLGLTYEEMRRIKPDLIWMNMPSFGSLGGPYQTYRTWGRNIAAIAGISRLIGWPDRDPVGMTVNYPDYVAALWGTVAVVCALLQRDLTGEGCEIDVSQYQVAVSCIGPTVMEAVLGGDGLGSLGNRLSGRAPQGVYPARDRDTWVSVAVEDDSMWAALQSVPGLEALAADPRFATVEGRLAHHDDIDAAISSWTQRLTAWETATELQAAGVAAHPVHDAFSLLADTHLHAREFFRVLPRPRFGRDLTYGQAMTMSGTPPGLERGAPGFGEHTREILSGVGGLTDAEIQGAIDAGVAHEMIRPDLVLERPYLHWIGNLLPGEWPEASLDPAVIVHQRLSSDSTVVTPLDPDGAEGDGR